jgi:hypothetical protein
VATVTHVFQRLSAEAGVPVVPVSLLAAQLRLVGARGVAWTWSLCRSGCDIGALRSRCPCTRTLYEVVNGSLRGRLVLRSNRGAVLT